MAELPAPVPYPEQVRPKLERLGFDWRAGRQRIGAREGSGYAATGTLDGQRLRVVVAGSVEQGWLALLLSGPVALDLGLLVEPKGFLGSGGNVTTGQEGFDQEFNVSGDEPARVRALLDDELTAAIAALGSLGGAVRVRDDQVEVEQLWGFLEFEPTLRGIARVARLIDQRAPGLPPPADLAGAFETWDGYAADHGLAISRTPLRLSGKGVAAQVMRTTRTEYRSQVSVALAEPLHAGLGLRPAGKLEHYLEALVGRDLQFGDAAFDRAFTVHAEQPDKVLSAFDQKVRGALVALASWGVVGFNDHGVTLYSTRHAELPTAIEVMREITAAVQANLRGGAGPYR